MAWVIGIGIFLFLLFAFPRPVVGLIVGLVVLCGVVIGGFSLWEKIKNDERAQKYAAVSVTVTRDLERCSPEYPLLVHIVNGSEDTVAKISFDILGHLAGYSDPLYDSGYGYYSSDRIIASGSEWTNCWPLPQQASGASEQRIALNPPESLIWSVKTKRPTFRER